MLQYTREREKKNSIMEINNLKKKRLNYYPIVKDKLDYLRNSSYPILHLNNHKIFFEYILGDISSKVGSLINSFY